MAAAHDRNALALELRRLNRYQLLLVDEVGYLPLAAAAASLFFQLVANRYETGSPPLVEVENEPPLGGAASPASAPAMINGRSGRAGARERRRRFR